MLINIAIPKDVPVAVHGKHHVKDATSPRKNLFVTFCNKIMAICGQNVGHALYSCLTIKLISSKAGVRPPAAESGSDQI